MTSRKTNYWFILHPKFLDGSFIPIWVSKGINVLHNVSQSYCSQCGSAWNYVGCIWLYVELHGFKQYFRRTDLGQTRPTIYPCDTIGVLERQLKPKSLWVCGLLSRYELAHTLASLSTPTDAGPMVLGPESVQDPNLLMALLTFAWGHPKKVLISVFGSLTGQQLVVCCAFFMTLCANGTVNTIRGPGGENCPLRGCHLATVPNIHTSCHVTEGTWE